VKRLPEFLDDVWEQFLLYLPLVFMGLLALGTYWMVRTTALPQAGTPQPSAPTHAIDYFMEHFSVKTFDTKGKIRSEIQGKRARHFVDTQWMEIDDIRIRSFDAQGHLSVASAQRGLTNEDGSEVQLMGNAVVVREPFQDPGKEASQRMEYRSEFLHAFMQTEQIRSHKPVELLRGQDRFTADSLNFDNLEQVLQLFGRVRGTLVPAPQR
jgi:lipopolysaccharide export system protein LptC